MPALPKPADKRVHRGKVSGPEFRAVQSNPAQQPDLPDRDRPWSPMTLEFWRSLGEAPVSEEFSDAEWRILMLAAFAYDEAWGQGKLVRIAEFEKLIGKFPFTPKDRQALRIQTLTGDEIERRKTDSRAGAQTSASKARYGELRAVGS